MKRHFIFGLIAILLANGCKKDTGSSSTPTQTYSPAYVARTQPGILMVSQARVVMHLSTSVVLTARLYQSDGTLDPNQPSFTWTSDDQSIANVSGGVVTAAAIGATSISVTDGSHGFCYTQIAVANDTVSIPATAVNISFGTPMVLLTVGQTSSFSYQLTDYQGQHIAGTPSFWISSGGTGLTIGNGTLSAANTPGFYHISARLGTDTLYGSMTVCVQSASYIGTFNAGGVSDTSVDVFFDAIPERFYKNGQSARPIVANVHKYWWTSSPLSFHTISYQSSPDAITIDNTNVLTVNPAGLITSVKTGFSNIILTYGKVNKNYTTYVYYDISGSWCAINAIGGSNGVAADTDYISINFPYSSSLIIYDDESHAGVSNYSYIGSIGSFEGVVTAGRSIDGYSCGGGTGTLILGVANQSGPGNYTIKQNDLIGYAPYAANGGNNGCLNFAGNAGFQYVDDNTLLCSGIYRIAATKITRGGNCTMNTGGTTPTGSYLIYQGNTSQLTSQGCTNDPNNQFNYNFSNGTNQIILYGQSNNLGYLPDGTYTFYDYVTGANSNGTAPATFVSGQFYNIATTSSYGFTSGTITVSGTTITYNGSAKEVISSNGGVYGYTGSSFIASGRLMCH